MDGSDLMSVINCISNALTPVSAIVGALISVMFIRRNTSDQEFEKIKAGQFNEAIEDLLDSGKLTYTEYYKAKNFLDIAKKADAFYSHKTEQSDEPEYNLDWFLRYYEAVGCVSDRQMQELWAKLLAGEVDNPGYHSFHLIEILKRMSKKDAILFNIISSFSIEIDEHKFIPNYKLYLSHYGITYEDLFRLDELDLINTNGMISLKVNVPTSGVVICNSVNKQLFAVPLTNKIETFSISQFPFTHAGCELRGIQSISFPDDILDTLITDLAKIKNIAFELRTIEQ